ncbi:MAG: hypothetical protein U0232_04145 [Thermomicrobiales bacterium]
MRYSRRTGRHSRADGHGEVCMCGITGFWGRGGEAAELDTLAGQMAAPQLAHRGPDDHGTWSDPTADFGLGFRRLAIVDLSPNGHQPMHSASGRYVLAYNGEVYNFATLRRELLPLGHRFRGGSDTEVILAAIEEWGLRDAVRLRRHVRHRPLGSPGASPPPRPQPPRDQAVYYGRVGGTFLFGSN